ncbi:hypothetical protein FKX85_03135 [Echinicola soli]|uniref:Uncharacterized protein n=1 Tax=Echinicola soli TaxID=2591634 RepID=A0A514CE24_9BACT|nr:hypothetical protein [Echinicola soli]QDH78082.1 hypothetical protein FKX85_03135 [Echinicola soli]
MKGKNFILEIISVWLLSSCIGTDRLERVNRDYELKNGTSHNMKVDFYQMGHHTGTVIISGTGLIRKGMSSNDGGNYISGAEALSMDSVGVTYNDTRRQIYYYSYKDHELLSLPESTRNILDDRVFEVVSNILYRFTFTEEDYQNAEVIEGD